MKRIACAALTAAVLAVGVAGCKKAHNAGNDTMSIGNPHLVASAGALV